MAAFGRGAQRAAVEDRHRWLWSAAGGQAQKLPEVVDHLLKDADGEPPSRLLVDRLPQREIVRQHPPGGARAHDPPQGVEGLAQVVDALGSVLSEQREVGGDEGLFLIARVCGVRLLVRHARMLPLPR